MDNSTNEEYSPCQICKEPVRNTNESFRAHATSKHSNSFSNEGHELESLVIECRHGLDIKSFSSIAQDGPSTQARSSAMMAPTASLDELLANCPPRSSEIECEEQRGDESTHDQLRTGANDGEAILGEVNNGGGTLITPVDEQSSCGISSNLPERPDSPQPSEGGESPCVSEENRGSRANRAQKAKSKSASPMRRNVRRMANTNHTFGGSPKLGAKLWDPYSSPARSRQNKRANQKHHEQHERLGKPRDTSKEENETSTDEPSLSEDAPMSYIRQPETRPISQEQLVAEVKGIYAGLVMVESKCIEVDNAESRQSDATLNNEQWQALIALHRTLLHEHHDFFLASQHPSATGALRRLAGKYAMPARMWRHGIHSFLELLRHRLPTSLEHMLTFIYLAYSMMALLYETVPAFEDTWIECLGDLGRYRMAIEDDDIRDREIWAAVSRHWYSKASDKAPTTGRLYHHLAILARPNALQQLFYYRKSLCVPIPFVSATESIMTLFEPILKGSQPSRLIPIDFAFIKAHGILFSGRNIEEFDSALSQFLNLLPGHIDANSRRWMQPGYYIGISNCCALVSYGKEANPILKAIRSDKSDDTADIKMSTEESEGKVSEDYMQRALRIVQGTHEVVLCRNNDPNMLPYAHVVLVFLAYMTGKPEAMAAVEQRFPWRVLASQLNSILLSNDDHARIQSTGFPREQQEPPRPLPEDYAMKGLIWAEDYFPSDWFCNEVDDDQKYFEVASMTDARKERILWLGCQIARHEKWLSYDNTEHRFSVGAGFDQDKAEPMDLS